MKYPRISFLILILFLINSCCGLFQFNFCENSYPSQLNSMNYQDKTELDVKSSSKFVNISGVPYYDQLVYYWCGDACLQMVFDFFGENISQLEIGDVARTESHEGTWEDDMRRATHFSNLSTSVGNEIYPANITGYSNRAYGYTAFEQHFTNASDLTSLIDAGYPIIVLQWMTDSHIYGHFRVVIGYEAFDNGTIDKFYLLDPWPSYGPIVEQNYTKFLEYWDFSSNWSLFINPLDVKINCLSIVEKDSNFTVTATVNYTCPIYAINPQLYNLTSCNATINLPTGFSLASEENSTKEVNNGVLPAGDVATIQWEIVADQFGANGPITITIDGLLNGSVQDHPYSPAPAYNYTDWIRSIASSNISVNYDTTIGDQDTPRGDDPMVFILILSLGGIGATIGIGIMIKFVFKKKSSISRID